MGVKETRNSQKEFLKKICKENGVKFEYLEMLLDSVRAKKLLSKRNYHQQKLEDLINKAIK